ncbi:Uncharacterised protein [Bordetella ansorpii]|uniref:Uncharacterized protein n=1 Tax=Bordetella ansorpii TaxID=288768 RepID=A0A157RLG4_9BORD|nr:hypothetical protein [Bordetella ansorpii]SAI58795.1 Uncharacterised protein [Bordetella ansorpii]
MANPVSFGRRCQDLDTQYLYDEDLPLVVHHAASRPAADLVADPHKRYNDLACVGLFPDG